MELFIAIAIILAFFGFIYLIIWGILSLIFWIIYGLTAPWFVALAVFLLLFWILGAYEEKIGRYFEKQK